MKKDIVRRCRFRPYRAGPEFHLTMWDTHRTIGGKSRLGYSLDILERWFMGGLRGVKRSTLFTGEDFGASPMCAIDSDETVRDLMGFLTLRPGDTDAEYFAGYTPEQLAYCDEYAEALSCEVESRFGGTPQ